MQLRHDSRQNAQFLCKRRYPPSTLNLLLYFFIVKYILTDESKIINLIYPVFNLQSLTPLGKQPYFISWQNITHFRVKIKIPAAPF